MIFGTLNHYCWVVDSSDSKLPVMLSEVVPSIFMELFSQITMCKASNRPQEVKWPSPAFISFQFQVIKYYTVALSTWRNLGHRLGRLARLAKLMNSRDLTVVPEWFPFTECVACARQAPRAHGVLFNPPCMQKFPLVSSLARWGHADEEKEFNCPPASDWAVTVAHTGLGCLTLSSTLNQTGLCVLSLGGVITALRSCWFKSWQFYCLRKDYIYLFYFLLLFVCRLAGLFVFLPGGTILNQRLWWGGGTKCIKTYTWGGAGHQRRSAGLLSMSAVPTHPHTPPRPIPFLRGVDPSRIPVTEIRVPDGDVVYFLAVFY